MVKHGDKSIVLGDFHHSDGKEAEGESASLSDAQILRFAKDLVTARREIKDTHRQLAGANRQLEKYAGDLRKTISGLKSAKREVENAYFDTIRRLVTAAEYKDRDTGNHISRISAYSALLAKRIGLDTNLVKTLVYAAPMHDIGKIGIPDRILLKNGTLLAPEYELMKCHTLIGANILAESKADVLRAAEQIALYHHEKWNGEGYPEGLSGERIPLNARIVALVDTFDALTSKRPYKAPLSTEKSLAILKSERGRHFDPVLVDIFLANVDDLLRIRKRCNEDARLMRDPLF
ncbi:MAG: HD domain-containing protein [Chitinivibrionales bacterium]|nr:HD domain-containing protein [Chitinivibrionales bacterium]MBD3356930.1 HD domain-containing protein [Chitinivibrionales bacterium]